MKIGVLPAALCAALFLPAAAEGHAMRCGDRDLLVEQLNSRYQELKIAMGVNHNGVLIELFATPDGRTWTLLATKPPLPTCILQTGHGWREFKQEVEGEES